MCSPCLPYVYDNRAAIRGELEVQEMVFCDVSSQVASTVTPLQG